LSSQGASLKSLFETPRAQFKASRQKTCPFLAPGCFSLKSANAQFADERASIMKTLQGLKTNDISSIFIPMDLA
jgi:hypothetical protein